MTLTTGTHTQYLHAYAFIMIVVIFSLKNIFFPNTDKVSSFIWISGSMMIFYNVAIPRLSNEYTHTYWMWLSSAWSISIYTEGKITQGLRDETWVTGKHMAATVATTDTAKNNPKRTVQKKSTTDTSGREIIRSGNEDQIHGERTGQERRGESGTGSLNSGAHAGKSSATWQAKQTNKSKFKEGGGIMGKADIFPR